MVLEISDINVSHSCAWTCSAIAIFCVGFGSDLYVIASDGFSLNDTSHAISASFSV